MSQTGKGSPWVTTTNGTNNAIVWVVGTEGDQRLHGYDGDTGAIIYAGGGPNELMANTRKWNTGIVARGRIYFAADNKVYAFAVPTGTPTPTPTPTGTPTPTPTATPPPSPTPTPTPTATPTPPPTPEAPSNLIATASACLQITLDWTDNSSTETGFKIERSLDNVTFQQITQTAPNVTTFVSTLRLPGLRYYRVRAFRRVSGVVYNSDYSNTASATVEACVTPTPTYTPTPTASPTSTPTPAPTATPTATPTPTPISQCTVPNFIGVRLNRAQSIWTNAGFTTRVTTIGPGGHSIMSQSLPAGYVSSCTTTTITVTAR